MKHQQRSLGGFFSIIGLIAVWLTVIPAQFGGQAAYVIVNGNSMEPDFHRGDLVILHRAEEYQVGDIATFRHPSIGPVIHRIIGREDDRFIFQGDNNDWIDPYRPTQEELIGKFWLHIPSAGKYLGRLRAPWLIAVLATVITVAAAVTFQGQKRHRGSRSNRTRSKGQMNSMENQGNSKMDLLFILGVLALGSLILAYFAFTSPISEPVSEDISYEQTGLFSYSAAAPPGIYTTDTVQPGEPIFRQLINFVNVNFDYHLVSDLPAELAGTYRLLLEISHPNGWAWTIELQPTTSFSGPAFNAGGVIDLAQVQALIDSVEQQTGLQQQQYTLTVIPEVFINGILAGKPLMDEFSPRLTFQLDKLQMQLADKRAGDQDPFKRSQTGALQKTREAPKIISIIGFKLEVLTARIVAVLGTGFSLAGIIVVSWLILQARLGDEASRLKAKYGSLLITVRSVNLGPESRTVEVAQIEDLVKIAERNGRMILHQAQQSTHHYFVQDGNLTYHYQLIPQDSNPVHPTQVIRTRPL